MNGPPQGPRPPFNTVNTGRDTPAPRPCFSLKVLKVLNVAEDRAEVWPTVKRVKERQRGSQRPTVKRVNKEAGRLYAPHCFSFWLFPVIPVIPLFLVIPGYSWVIPVLGYMPPYLPWYIPPWAICLPTIPSLVHPGRYTPCRTHPLHTRRYQAPSTSSRYF